MTTGRRFLYLHMAFLVLFLLSGTSRLCAKEQSTVTIENARKTSYYTDEDSGDEIIIFTGGVVVSVKQKNTTTTISADTVHFNRTRNMLYAEGTVTLERSGGGKDETMTADSLLLDVDTQEGVFNEGRIIQSGANSTSSSSDSQIIVSADIFGRDDSGAVAFKKGALTFCDDENPHWKIKASRIWLLPGNEFAFANALLYVGHVPVLYFPFFYYPKDELIFNPVFGYRQREGYFIQTTTYLIGRKPLDTSTDDDSFLSFMKDSKLKKQRREGLVLRNLDEDDNATYPNTLKIMADYYTNLGGMVGVDGVFKPEDTGISQLDFSVYIGMSRTIFPLTQNGSLYYTAYSTSGDTFYNKSDFLGLSLPFRYKGNFKMAMTSPFSLSISMPIYSDPFFQSDFFYDRKENMDWLDFLMSSADDSDEDTPGETTSFNWTLSASYSPKLNALKPYISTMTLSPSASIYFSAKSNTAGLSAEEAAASPQRKFFYPSQIKPFSMSLKLDGTIFSYPKTSTSGSTSGKKSVSLNVPQEFMDKTNDGNPAAGDSLDGDNVHTDVAGTAVASDEDTAADEASTNVDSQGETVVLEDGNVEPNKLADVETDDGLPLTFPLISVTNPKADKITGITYSLTYSIRPQLTTEIAYDAPASSSDFEWKDLKSSFYKFTSPVELKSKLGYRDSFLSLSNALSFSPTIQRHPEYNAATGKETALKNDYSSQKMDMTNTNNLSFKPFVYNTTFRNTSISWDTGIKLIRTSFIGTVDAPEWEYELPEWDEEAISSNKLNFTFYAEEGKFHQKLTLSTELPPRVESYTANLSLGFPYLTVTASGGVKQKSATDETWVFNDFTNSVSLSILANKLTLSSTFKYDIEEETPSSFSLNMSGYGLSLSYSMSYSNNYEYNASSGWKTTKEKDFQPIALRLRYSSGTKNFTFLNEKVKLSPSLSTEIEYNMQRPTNSYLSFTPRISFIINDFLTLTFSSTSRNQVIYRYIQKYTGFEPQIPGETNIFKDLLNSFAFGDDSLRESSGFKLKTLNVGLTHDLHDWKLTSELEIEPRIITENGLKRYDFSPYFTISVVWKPMESIKTTIEDEYGTFILNP